MYLYFPAFAAQPLCPDTLSWIAVCVSMRLPRCQAVSIYIRLCHHISRVCWLANVFIVEQASTPDPVTTVCILGSLWFISLKDTDLFDTLLFVNPGQLIWKAWKSQLPSSSAPISKICWEWEKTSSWGGEGGCLKRGSNIMSNPDLYCAFHGGDDKHTVQSRQSDIYKLSWAENTSLSVSTD